MSFCAGARSLLEQWRCRARALVGDRRGIAAVEFAIIAPLLLSLYFVTMEVSQGIETNKKVSRVGSMVADLVTQQQTTTTSEIDAIMKIGESILQPYNRSVGKIVITAIEITDEPTPQVKVAWSRKLVNGTASMDAPKDAATTVPTALRIRGTFLIRVVSDLDYLPVIVWSPTSKSTLGLGAAFASIPMSETYYLRPRMSASVPCTNC